ncbi:TKL/TKL-ccin protein kinase [Favolaschia claudopus]|uniref:TKL/TKL-ccin protein kinase n=1 Tax=Favolaschia claudopus TaxID=2862362 RepID=A0AAW0CQ77_9AGAR
MASPERPPAGAEEIVPTCDSVQIVEALSNMSLPPDLDLTGEIVKTDAFPIEFGRVADIFRGNLTNSRKIQSQVVAIKIFRLHMDDKVIRTIKACQDLYDVSVVWGRLDHPNILPFLGIALDLGPSPALISPFQLSGNVLQHLDGALKATRDRFDFVQGIAEGLMYLHSEGVVHGNLTTKKILVSEAGAPMICGHGLASIAGRLSTAPSARFTAPEYYINENTESSHNTQAGDVYSLSMVILEIMSGVRPYHHLHTEHSVILHIMPGGRPSRSELDPGLVSDRLWRFLKYLWSHQPVLRPDMSRVLLALQSLQTDPTNANTEAAENEIDPLISYATTDDFDIEEVSFGHPCLSHVDPQSLKGRLFRTDEYPFFNGGNSYIYRGQLIHQDGFRIHVAIKVIRVSNDGSGQLNELLRRLTRETKVWSRLNHRNLLPFLGVWDEVVAPGPVLISPFFKSGDLGQYLRICPTVDKEKMILGVASGLDYLHREEIVHGDLKVNNVLVDKVGRPCIGDFGISKIVNFQGFTTSSVGTPPYMAPELFLVLGEVGGLAYQAGPTTKNSDVYSFALLALEILTTNPPKNRPTRPILTSQGHGSLRPRRTDYDVAVVSPNFWEVLDDCWDPDPYRRPTISDVIVRIPLDDSNDTVHLRLGKIPELNVAVETFHFIRRVCHELAQNRYAAGQISARCYRLLLELVERRTEVTSMQSEAITLCGLLHRIHTSLSVGALPNITRLQAILQETKVAEAIIICHSLISHCSVELNLNPHLNTQEQTLCRANIEKDHEDVMNYLAAVQTAQTIGEEMRAAQSKDIIQLMSMMQQMLKDNPVHSGLSSNLYDLLSKSRELLPDFRLGSGEVVRIAVFPKGGTSYYDVYEGLYLGREKVSIKVLRSLNADERSLRRFYRECNIWKIIWEIDLGRHIVPIYGFCQEDGPFPYMVSPWMSNGTALSYVKTQPNVDYKQIIEHIAIGMKVLHTMVPAVIHGDLKASNIWIDNLGNPLISDFGLSQILEDITGSNPLTQSRGVNDSYRWFAPETDIYAYGMTVLELLTHEQPYNNIKHTAEVVIRAARGEQPSRPVESRIVERGLTDELWALLCRCWATKPTNRPNIQEISSFYEESKI